MTFSGEPLACTWFDGVSPRAQAVSVHVEEGTLVVDTEQGTRRYPVRDVRWPERFQAGIRAAHLPDGSVLQHADSPTWDAWQQANVGQRRLVAEWAQNSSAIVYAILGIFLILGVAWFWLIPVGARLLVHHVPYEFEAKVGQYALKEIRSYFLAPTKIPASQQEDYRAQFSGFVEKAYPKGDAPPYQIHFYSAELLGPNAFALPGGEIVVTDELITLLKEHPKTLLGVLGHELGHVQNKDGMEMLISASISSVLLSAITGDMGAFLASIPGTIMSNAYSRDIERRADAHAAQMMHANAMAPAELATFFELLEAEEITPSHGTEQACSDDQTKTPGKKKIPSEELPIAISSHPGSAERITFLREWKPPVP